MGSVQEARRLVARKKAQSGNAEHEITTGEYKSKVFNTTLFEASCSCGWEPIRFFEQGQADAAIQQHLQENG